MASNERDPVFELSAARLRRWRWGDEAALVRHADDRAVWLNVRDAFPSPYRHRDARDWLRQVTHLDPLTNFAIEVDGEAAGAIGLELRADVYSGTAEIGYWLGRAFWGRGIGTEAVKAVTGYGFTELGLRRIYAEVFGWNAASARVLEKVGYLLEGRAVGAIVKAGDITDGLRYAMLGTQWGTLTGQAPH